MVIIAAHCVQFSLMQLSFRCRERVGVVFIFVYSNIPCLFTMQISSLLCMLIMVDSKNADIKMTLF